MTLKKTAYVPFLTCFRTLSDFMFCRGLRTLTVLGKNTILTQIHFQKQNIFFNVCTLLTLLSHHLKSSDRIKPSFQIKSLICSFE